MKIDKQDSTTSYKFLLAPCSIGGHQDNYLLLTDISSWRNSSITSYNLTIYGGTDCQLRLLAVGGGGSGNACGGGSGYIQYHEIPELSLAYSPYTVAVTVRGSKSNNRTSSVEIHGSSNFSTVIINALPGQDGTRSKGGDGYSGGKVIIIPFN